MLSRLTPTKLLFIIFAVGGLIYFLNTPYFSQLASATLQLASTPATTNLTLDDGLVLHYTYDGNDIDWSATSAEILDSSSAGNDGNATNFSVSSGAVGKIGQALTFNSALSTYINAGSATSLDDLGPITITAWVKNGSNGFLAYKGSGIPVGGGWSFAYGASLEFRAKFDSSGPWSFSGIGCIYTNEWCHVAVTWDGSASGASIDFYKDGTQLSETPITSGTGDKNFNDSTDLYLGSSNVATNRYNGLVDDFRIYNRVLSQAEIEQIYQMGEGTKFATTPTHSSDDPLNNGLVGHWTFDGPDVDWGSSTAEIRDKSGNENHGNALGGMNVDSVTPGVLGQGMGFDGTSDNVALPNDNTISAFPFSVSAWVKLSSGTAGIYTADDFSVSSDRQGFKLYSTGQKLGAYYYPCSFDNSTCRRNKVTNDAVVPLNTWSHVSAVFVSSSDIRLYVDGEEHTGTYAGSGATALQRGSAGDRIGLATNVDSNTWYSAGSIDDLRIYNRALSADEVMRLYKMGEGTKISTTIKSLGSPLEQGLVGHWTFDGPDVRWQDTTSEIKDVSGNANHGDAQGGMNVDSVTPGVLGQGMGFDGVSNNVQGSSIAGMDFDSGSGSFAVGGWFKVDSLNGGDSQWRPFEAAYCTAAPSYMFLYIATTTQSIQLQVQDDNGVLRTAGS
ncbi:LamG domain-containing protein, partial [Candidatus Kaiserbacteria bacterium]|nr:LamG domain-containing protein [Candidatus Kaiserbacteria bacterium]